MDDRDFPKLEQAVDEIWAKAREMGLDPFPVHFEIVPSDILYEFGAYLLPGRFSHWTHGKSYYQLKTQYDYGLSKIYELVINADPCYAFLLENNTLLQNKFVVAHVMGHSDFFKNSVFFSGTNRQMVETVGQNARRIRAYAIEEGNLAVERFLDAALSIANHVDPYPRREPKPRAEEPERVPNGAYEDLFPRTARERRPPWEKRRLRAPAEPESDLLRFLAEHGRHLEEWQRDVLAIVRAESLYFIPQMQTKIINEGWATYWHTRILRELALSDEDYTDFARLHAGICLPGRTHLNPYLLGFRILEDIEARLGREALSAVRELENDASLVRSYLTQELVEELDLYVYAVQDNEWRIIDNAWERVRDRIADSLTNFGIPVITVEDGDWKGAGELYLKHHYDDRPLDVPYAERTLQYVGQIWGKPVHLETLVDEKRTLISCDDGKVTRKAL